MNKEIYIYLLLCISFILSCEEIPNEIVEANESEYFLVGFNTPDSFHYSETTKSLLFSVEFDAADEIKSVEFTISSQFEDIGSGNLQQQSNSLTFSGEFEFPNNILSDNYTLSISVNDIYEKSKSILAHNFILTENIIQYELVDFDAPSSFNFTDENTELKFSAVFLNSNDINKISYQIKNSTETIVGSGQMVEDEIVAGNFNAVYPIGNNLEAGNYDLSIIVHDILGDSTNAATQTFQLSFDENLAPVLSNLVAPESVLVEPPKSLIFLSIGAFDRNGMDDIKEVYFTVKSPSGTVSNQIFMFDDGNTSVNGDNTADDGKYSAIIEVTPDNQKGNYRFDFFAKDQTDLLSKVFTHFIEIQ